MQKLQRIKTIILYSWYHLNHSLETWVDLLWIPIIQVLVFGLLASYMGSGGGNISQLIIFGLISWQIIQVVKYSITVGMMWDIWSRNFSTLFISPLNMHELIIGQAVFGLVKTFFITLLLLTISWFLYGFSALALGCVAILHFFLLSLFAVSAGIFIMALIIRFGTDIQSLSWSLIYMFQPISAVLYPVEILPKSVRFLAYMSPVTYSMEASRAKLSTGEIMWDYFLYCFLLNVLYLVFSLAFLKLIKNWAHKSGAFARMEG